MTITTIYGISNQTHEQLFCKLDGEMTVYDYHKWWLGLQDVIVGSVAVGGAAVPVAASL